MYKHVDEIIWKTLIISGIISFCLIPLIIICSVLNVAITVNTHPIESVFVNIFTCSGFVFTACLIWFNSVFVPDARWHNILKSFVLSDRYTVEDYMITYESIKHFDIENYEQDRYDFSQQYIKGFKNNVKILNRFRNLFRCFENRVGIYSMFGMEQHKEYTKKSQIFIKINTYLKENNLNRLDWSHSLSDLDCSAFNHMIKKLYKTFQIDDTDIEKIFNAGGGFCIILDEICKDINKNFIVDGKKDEHFNMYLYECLTESMNKESPR